MKLSPLVLLLVPGLALGQAYPSPIIKGLQFGNNLVYTGPSSASNSWLFIPSLTISGTASTPTTCTVTSPMNLCIANDTVDTTTSGSGILSTFEVTESTRAGFTGGRSALYGNMHVEATPGALGNGSYVGGTFVTGVNANLTGTTGAYANYKGGVFGSNSNAFTTSLATFLSLINASEFDVAIASGASAAEKHGITIVQTSADAVRGAYDDSAVEFVNQNSSSTTWQYGISFGGYGHVYPFGTDSTLITAQSRVSGGVSNAIALNGVDFSGVTFQTNGCAFKSTGFCINPAGVINDPTSTTVIGGPLSLGNGNVSAPSWTTGGVGFKGTGTTYTDSTASGVVTTEAIYAFPASTIAATNIGTTITNLDTLFLATPLAGTNVTATNAWSLHTQGKALFGGQIQGNLGANVFGATTQFNVSSNFNTNINTGTSSGTVTLGAGSGTVNIVDAVNINSNANFATNIGTGSTSSTVTVGGGSNAVTTNATTATIQGTVQMNNNQNNATNINTGSSSGIITIGNSGNTGKTVLGGITTGTNADFLCLAAGGTVLLQTSACTISSARFKENIKAYTGNALAQLAQLTVSTFRMKGENRDPNHRTSQVGLIAENVALIVPQCAIYEDDMVTPKSYRQECVTALAVRALQQQGQELQRTQILLGVMLFLLVATILLLRPRHR